MDEIKIDAATLEEAGAAIGFMFAAFLRGFKEGVDAYDVMEAANDCWALSCTIGGLSVEYKVPKDICADAEELRAYVEAEELF